MGQTCQENHPIDTGLQSGVILKGRYRIERKISVSELSIVYLVLDQQRKQECIIKEYFPRGSVLRDMDEKTVVYKKPSFKKKYYEAIDVFLKEAEILKEHSHTNIAEYIDHFKENDTGYIVIRYYSGKTLDKYMEEGEISYEQLLRELFLPLINAIGHIHRDGIIHRDIKPGNIIVDKDGIPIIIDFGSAIKYKGSKSKRIFYTPNYSPLEFYSEKSKQGRYSDIYSIAATMYYCLTGKPPLKVTQRVIEDKIEKLESHNKEVSTLFSNVVMKNLSVDYKKRFSSLKFLKFYICLECMLIKMKGKV